MRERFYAVPPKHLARVSKINMKAKSRDNGLNFDRSYSSRSDV